ncbi:MAG: glycoside hydrolase, partial [Anaerolineae bacterium]|nr:glycoside hydrolase [Anaerolineae bacterium]
PEWSQGLGMAPADMRPPPAMPGASGLLSVADRLAPLRYRLLVGVDATSAFRRLIQALGKPPRTPPEGLLRRPIWTSWARYKSDIDQAKIVDFAREIRAHEYPGGTLEIDDRWQRAYGDTQFDPVRFPDPAGMVRTLDAMGFAVTLWVPTFLNPDSLNAQEAEHEGYLVRRPDGSPYPVTWWQGTGYLLDLSHPGAVQWWAERLGALQRAVGLAGYKFDAGEANFLPADAVTHAPMGRNEYSTRWAEFAAQHFPYCEARCGWFSQRQPVLFRQWDKFSVWGHDNGLASVITTALALSMTGYPFTLPDMVGGNAYAGVEPDKELFIRWAQASAPMLAIQFSLAPWDFDKETDAICRRYAQLHVDLADARVRAAHNAVETGEPVLRPIFWNFPRDAEAQVVGDEYLLGDEYLVAPVVEPGKRTRDVYLPAGRWREYWSRREHLGGQWLRNFPAPLDTLPLFVRRA